MVMHRIVSVLLLVVLSFVSASTTYEGYGTVYTLSSPSDGNCNFMSWPSDAVTKYAALNAEQWEETMNCGRCAEVTCTDSSCAGQSSEIVYIMDQCPGCEYGDLDLSPDVFESITGQSYTKLSIEWKFVDCPVSNNVQYCLKTGSSEFWVAVQPANFVSGVQSLSINGKETSVIDSAYYFLIDGSGESVADLSSMSISLTGVNGEVIEETVSMTADKCTEGNSQFSSSGDTSQTTTTSKPSTTTSAPTTAAPTSTPTLSTAAPTTPSPTTAAPTTAPVTEAPVTEAPTTAPATEAPTTAPVTEAPTTVPVTEAPTTAPVTTAPLTKAPTAAPVTETPTSKPTTAAPTATPTSTPAVQSTSTSSDASHSSLASADQDTSVLAKSTSTAAVSTNSTSSNTDQESEHSVATEESSTSTTQVSSSTTVESTTSAPTPTSTPAATQASVQKEASNSGGLHSTAAIVGLIAAVCVALGAAIGVGMVVHKKRKLLEESKNMEDRDSFASYASIRTPRSEVPVMHSAV